MKKFIKISALALLMVAGTLAVQSFTTVTTSTEKAVKSNIEFKVVNDSSSEFKYCANGGHNYISKGASKGFSYSEGTELKYIDGSNCGKTWIKVTSSMHGKSYKLSELTR